MTPISTAKPTRCRAVDPCAGDSRRGFTLIELMVTVAIIGVSLTLMYSGSRTLLPQTRLKATAKELGAAIERVRTYTVLNHEEMVFAYDLDRNGYEAYLPYELDENDKRLGPGKTTIVEWKDLQEGIGFGQIRLPDSVPRDKGVVTVRISALGRVAPHEIVVLNVDYPETEVLTVRVAGLANRSEIIEGDVPMEIVRDVHFQ